jgi:hypothetical protein
MFSKYIQKKLSLCKKYINLYKNNQVITCINNINNRIIAIGDIHGDIDLMINTLIISGVIKKTDKCFNTIKLNNKEVKEYYEWIGGTTIVVQVGDQIDRCRPTDTNDCKQESTTFQDEASDIEILLFFTNLNELAKNYGGAVYSLLGNHELMNSFGDIRYVSYKNLEQVQIKEQSLENGRIQIFKRGDILSNFLACTRTSILIINNYLFVHGGILGSIISNIDTNNKCEIFEIINEVIKKWLMYDDSNLNTYLNCKYYNNNIYKKIFNKTDINQFIFSIDSPFYTRKLGSIKPDLNKNDPSCKEVNFLIDTLQLKGIIVGHTPQLVTGINGTCDYKLYRVDIASSKAFYYILNNKISPQVLEITKEKIQVLKYKFNF